MQDSGGRAGAKLTVLAPIAAAVILGGAVVYAASLVSRSLERTAERLEEIRAALASRPSSAEEALRTALAGGAGAPAERPRRGPDPERRYEIALGGVPVLGPAGAPVTIVEFSDFECPFCSRVGPTLERIRQEYGDRVRIAFKHLPLDFHRRAPAAHAAAVAAGQQGKFWEMHDRIFQNQQEMSAEKYEAWAAELGLDVERFRRDAVSSEVQQRIAADKQEAARLGVTGTPSFFINGRFLAGAQPFQAFKIVIDQELGS